ncbi:MAG: peptidase S10 [Ignavibacteria bacterium]|nr:peptidase S10 [Ignavibacteria bacterium]
MKATYIFFILILLFNMETESKEHERNEVTKPTPTSITTHTLSINGASVAYKASTGYLGMKSEDGKSKANIFYIAYTKDNEQHANRPITFAFNGGPGSSSVWLHMGALGPKRVVFTDEGNPLPPPYSMVDNEYSWLEFTDLVFIDPVSTGYSRPAGEEKKEQFHGTKEDAQSIGDFIRLYTSKTKRWLSPKYLAGESYGTTRAAMLASYLQERHGMYINGLILISCALDFSTLRFKPGHDLPHLLHFPTYTATAFFHKKLDPSLLTDLEKTLESSRLFAEKEYLPYLWKGDKVTKEEKTAMIKKIAYFTGLNEQFIDNTNCRIDIMNFAKELLRSEDRTIGRLDSRYKGIDRRSVGSSFEFDPSYDAVIYGPYTGTINHYVHENLQFESELPYEILTGNVHPWNWGSASEGYTSVTETLRKAMSTNNHLKVFVANGYYDLATPFYATEYALNHMELDESLRNNITMTYYPAGHMMYVQKQSLIQLTNDIRRFFGKK